MILLFTKSQQVLFDTPVRVSGSVRKDGVVVAPHVRIQKVALKKPAHSQIGLLGDEAEAPKRRTKLEAFIDRHGGLKRLAQVLASMPEGQQQQMFAAMAKLDKKTPEAVAEMFDGLAEKPADRGETLDLFSHPHAEMAVVEPAPVAPEEPAIVEHVTKKRGKTLRGVVRTDLTQDQAKEIDPYTFRKDGGWFIREKYLGKQSDEGPREGERNAYKLPYGWSDRGESGEAKRAAEPFGVQAGISKAERRRLNAAAVALVEEKTPGEMTEGDLQLLRQYSGNGGCGDSLNEFYTDPAVASAIWKVADRLGYSSGTCLEPSCATGVFLHTAPEGFKVTGVEMDPVSSKIAAALHGDRHEIVTASLERFATQDMRQFNVVVGNPPYGPRGLLAKDDKKNLSKAEEYFIDTSLDKTAPGGLCALVVPAGIMDSKNGRKFREQILRKAEFLGAQRMPNTAFEASHTDVTADVVYFRKRADDVAGALASVDKDTLKKLGVWDSEFLSGGYFEGRGKENVFGDVGTAMRAFGEIYTVNGSMRGVPEAIAAFEPHPVGSTPDVPDILDALPEQADKDRALSAANKRPYQDAAKVGDIRVIDGITYVLQGNPPRWHRADEAVKSDAVTEAQALASEIQTLVTGTGAVDRQKLEADIRAWVEKHGIPAKNHNLLIAASTDKALYRLIGAVGKDGELSDAVMGRTAKPATEGGFDTIARALALNHESGAFTHAELAESLGQDRDTVLDRLVADSNYAYLPNIELGTAGGWAPLDVYLTGDLWPKLDSAKAALAKNGLPEEMRNKLGFQVRRLEAAIDPKSIEDIDIQMNSAFVPTDILSAFMTWRNRDSENANKWTKELPPVEISYANGIYKITGGNHYGDMRLLDKYLNRTGVRKDDLPIIEALNDQFKDWLGQSEYRDHIEDLYNRKFRGFVQRDFAKEPIDVPGLANHDKIKDYQWPGLRWALAAGKGIIAADVGLGKTLRGLLLARMAKIDGRANKPVIVVPKSVLGNWYAETQKWFPGSKVLSVGATFAMKDGELIGRDDDANERKRKYHDLNQNDYDFVLISEPAFEELDLDPITKENYYSQDFWVQRGAALGNAGDKRRKKIKESYDQAIAKREFSDRTDAIYFNDIGIDMLIADEMHHQKNLYAAKARFGDTPKFLGGQGLSNRALDFNLKSRWILNEHGNKGVYGLTATPTKNSPLEIYSMLSHVAPEAFERIGIRNSEEFLDRFCVFEKDTILNTRGEIEEALVTAGFKNMNELREIMKRYIDRTTAEQVGLVLPKRDDHIHLVDMTPTQKSVYSELRELAEQSSNGKDDVGDSHIFSIMDKMNKAALDLEILDPAAYAGEPSPKYKSLAKHVVEGLSDGGQVVFADYLDAHDKIVDSLVASGVPRKQIGVINAQVAGSSVKRQNIADAFNSGKLKVVIGNTATMGEGINLQIGTADIHHLDLPWEPASLQQRNGRGLRQGNINEAVRIHTYMSKGSFDGYRYQSIAAKKDWQDLIWSGADRIDNLAREGKFSREELLVMLSADPEAARQQFESDKSAAEARYSAGERAKANEQFVRFQELRSGYKALKNKNTASAARLKQKLENARTELKSNRFFTAKHVLDTEDAAVVQPQTGEVFHVGIAFSAVGSDGKDEGRYVVTGVNPKAGTVSVRPYAPLFGARPKTVKLNDLAHGITPFKFSAAEEENEVAGQMEQELTDKAGAIKSFDDVWTLPKNIVERSNESIQRQLKEGAKSYQVQFPHGRVPMINRETGQIKMAAGYEHQKMGDTHDYLLPTEENIKRAEQAWMDAERGAKFGTSAQDLGRNKTKVIAEKHYPSADYLERYRNPFSSLVAKLSGDIRYNAYMDEDSASLKALRDRLNTEQMNRIKKAKTFNEALSEAIPLGRVSNPDAGHSATAAFPKRVLAMLWAKARHLGVLGDKIEDHEPRDPGSSYGKHSGYVLGSRSGNDVHAALIGMATKSGHRDLAAAMAESGAKHHKGEKPLEILKLLTSGYGHLSSSADTLRTAMSSAERAGVADKTIRELGHNDGLLHFRKFSGTENQTVRQVIQDSINRLSGAAS